MNEKLYRSGLVASSGCTFCQVTCANVCGAFFRTRNIHTLHSPVYLCWPLACLGVSLCVWAPFLERGVFTHLFRRVLDSSLACVVLYTACTNVYVRLFQNEKYSHTSFACLFVFAAWVFGGFAMFVGAIFRTRNIHIIHTPFSPVYLC